MESAWSAAEAAGHDMTLLQESLELTPDERLRLHDLAVARLERLELAMGRPHDIETVVQLKALREKGEPPA